MKQKHIYRLIFFFVMAFALGSLVGKIYSHLLPTHDPIRILPKQPDLFCFYDIPK